MKVSCLCPSQGTGAQDGGGLWGVWVGVGQVKQGWQESQMPYETHLSAVHPHDERGSFFPSVSTPIVQGTPLVFLEVYMPGEC